MKTFCQILRCAPVLVWLLAGVSCSGEPESDRPGGGETEVTFSLMLPAETGATRALLPADEKQVRTIDVYVFDNAGKLVDMGRAYNMTDVTGGGSVTVQNFTVKLREGTNREIMVLANAGNAVETAYSSGVPLDGTIDRNTFANAVTLGYPSTGRWITDTSDPAYTPIPMWGTKKGVNIGVDNLSGSNGIKISRMMAKVTVNLHPSITAADFTLTSVHLYNYNTRGRLVPDDGAGTWTATSPLASAPSLLQPAGHTRGPLSYNTLTSANELRGEIYAFEAEKFDKTSNATGPCLVVGGIYDGKEYFYRIDLARKSGGTTTYLHLLRNFHYIVTVKSVSGPGFDDKEDAADSFPVNIEAEVLDWNPYNLGVAIDGQNYLDVQPVDRKHWSSASTGNRITVETDHDDPWTSTVTYGGGSGTGWLTVDGVSDAGPGNAGFIEYSLSQYNTSSSASRTAYITVKAGRLSVEAKVEQTPWKINNISVTPQGDISPDGETRTILMDGVSGGTPVRVRDLSEDVVLNTGNIPAGTDRSTQVDIPDLWDDQVHIIAFEYFDLNLNDWAVIRTDQQSGYHIDIDVLAFNNGDAVPGPGQTYNVEVSGNWPALQLRAYDTTNDVSVSPLPLATIAAGTTGNGGPKGTGTVTVGANTTWDPRDVVFQYSSDGTRWMTIDNLTGTQSGYDGYLTIGHTQNEEIPGPGKDYTITAYGYRPDLYMRAVIAQTSTIVAPAVTVLDSEATKTISMPAFDVWNASRDIQFQWSKDGFNWIDLSSGIQKGYEPIITSNMGSEVPGGGYTYIITVSGYYPDLWFRVRGNSILAGTTTPSNIPGGNTTITIEAKVSNNQANGNAQPRTIYLQYSENDHATEDWHTINEADQPVGNYWLSSTTRLAATSNIKGLSSWAIAMGISTEFNYKYFYNDPNGGPHQDNANYTPTTETGCAGYYEGDPDDPMNPGRKGQWRMTTYQELNEMFSLGVVNGSNRSSSEYSATQVYSRGSNGSIPENKNSTIPNTRCVRADN